MQVFIKNNFLPPVIVLVLHCLILTMDNYNLKNEDVDHKALTNWLSSFDRFVRLDSNHNLHDTYAKFDTLIGAGTAQSLTITNPDKMKANEQLDDFIKTHQGEWVFGQIAYEANQLFEDVPTAAGHFIPVPLLSLFVPLYVLEVRDGGITVLKSPKDYDQVLAEIKACATACTANDHPPFELNRVLDYEEYMQAVISLKQHIHKGNIYEINFCQPVHGTHVKLQASHLYHLLKKTSKAPFGAFTRHNDVYLCCASPERFLAKRGNRLICQPIKGTNRRLKDPDANTAQIKRLATDEKERAENIMIVDLMRNDLTRICQPGTIQVDELCGIYAFEHVNQMISTISGVIRAEADFADALRCLYPMGSMTGAPKISAMTLIAQSEVMQRGLYSGTVGYLSPDGDWDWNVVIRSIIYDDAHQKLSISAGGAITDLANAETEYEESLLKMEGLLDLIKKV